MLTFGEKLSDLRKDAKMTQQELADYLGYDKSYISKMENDIAGNISTCLLIEISKKFDVSTDWLLGLPNSVKKLNADEDNKKASAYTGLSSEAIEKLHRFNERKKQNIFRLNEAKKLCHTQKVFPAVLYGRITDIALIELFINEFDNGISSYLSNYNEQLQYIVKMLSDVESARTKQLNFANKDFEGFLNYFCGYVPNFKISYLNSSIEEYEDKAKKYSSELTLLFKDIIYKSSPYCQLIADYTNKIENLDNHINKLVKSKTDNAVNCNN